MSAGLASRADDWSAPSANVQALYWNGRQGWFLDGTAPSRSAPTGDSTSGQSSCHSLPFIGRRQPFCPQPTPGG